MENKQHVCDMMCKAIQATDAGGNPMNNPLKELRYMKLDNGYEIVRPIFEDGTGSNGSYDIYVNCDSGIAIIMDIVKQFVREVW